MCQEGKTSLDYTCALTRAADPDSELCTAKSSCFQTHVHAYTIFTNEDRNLSLCCHFSLYLCQSLSHKVKKSEVLCLLCVIGQRLTVEQRKHKLTSSRCFSPNANFLKSSFAYFRSFCLNLYLRESMVSYSACCTCKMHQWATICLRWVGKWEARTSACRNKADGQRDI